MLNCSAGKQLKKKHHKTGPPVDPKTPKPTPLEALRFAPVALTAPGQVVRRRGAIESIEALAPGTVKTTTSGGGVWCLGEVKMVLVYRPIGRYNINHKTLIVYIYSFIVLS